MYFYRIHYRKNTLLTETRISKVVESSVPLDAELLQTFVEEKERNKLVVLSVEPISKKEYEEVKRINSFFQ